MGNDGGGLVQRPRQRVTTQQLAEVARLHAMYQSGRLGGKRAVLQYRDMSGLNLSSLNLSDADFTGSFLLAANLAGTNLDQACLFGCNLSEANLRGASLSRADLRGCCLRGANLTDANLFDADLRDGRLAQKGYKGELYTIPIDIGASELVGAVLVNANLSQARMGGSFAVHTDFSDAVMKGVKLVRADLRHANLSGANLEGADMSGADLRDATLRDAVLTGATMTYAETSGADMSGALTDQLAGKPLSELGAPIEELIRLHELWVNSNGAEGKPINLCGFDLRNATSLTKASLTALKASKAVFYGLNLEGIWWQAAQLDWADLRSCKLAGADLRGVNLTKARLNYADLRDCNMGPLVIDETRVIPSRLDEAEFRYADLRGANLRRASLRKVDLTSAKLDGAHLDGADLTGAILNQTQGLDSRPASVSAPGPVAAAVPPVTPAARTGAAPGAGSGPARGVNPTGRRAFA